MDRNSTGPASLMASTTSLSARRAWIEISGGACARPLAAWSLSARRAWIEIIRQMPLIRFCPVALRKESVDRNRWNSQRLSTSCLSLSARRAWIEIVGYFGCNRKNWVALRKESVDRNCRYPARCVGLLSSLSARRAWIEIPALLSNDQNSGSRSPQGERG